jgi:hypothetical protein
MRTQRLAIAALFACLSTAAPAFPQFGRLPGRVGGRTGTSLPPAVPGAGKQPKTGKEKPAQEPLATFTGTVRGADSKTLTLEGPESNTLVFHCSKKTRYFSGSKKIKPSAIQAGDRVSVEATRAVDGTLDAVNVRREKEQKNS